MRIVRTRSQAWENGRDVIAAMEPAWRANLGPADRLDDTYGKHSQITLYRDARTTQRGDLVRLDPGYADLTDAYHGTVEECLFLTGDCTLSGEGTFHGGDYFWRPPGFIHAATSQEGFTALLMVEGESAAEASGPASRVIMPGELAGTNALHDDLEQAVGPRGWVRLSTRFLPWVPGPAWARDEGGLAGFGTEQVQVKVLSRNAVHGGQSILLRLLPGYAQAFAGSHAAGIGAFVLSGSLRAGPEVIEEYSWVSAGPGEVHEPWSSPAGATLFCKIPGFLDFRPAP